MVNNNIKSTIIDLSVIIVNYKTPTITNECITSLKEHLKCNYEIIVVDNNSEDNSEELIRKKHNNICWLQLDDNMGYGYAMNKGFEKSAGEYILILNSDIMILSNFFDSLKANYLKLNAGAIGIQLILPNNKVQQTASTYTTPITLFANELKLLQNINNFKRYTLKFDSNKLIHKVDWVTGAFMFISREKYREISGFNDSYFMYFEDVDLCRKLESKGYSNYYITEHKAIHKHGFSVNKQKDRDYNLYKVIEKESAINYISNFYDIKTFNKFLFLYRLLFLYKFIMNSFSLVLLFFIKRKRGKINYAIKTNLSILDKINYYRKL